MTLYVRKYNNDRTGQFVAYSVFSIVGGVKNILQFLMLTESRYGRLLGLLPRQRESSLGILTPSFVGQRSLHERLGVA